MTHKDIDSKILNNKILIDKIIHFKTIINLEPNKEHYCVSIKKEAKSFIGDDFIDALKTTITSWVFENDQIKSKKLSYKEPGEMEELQDSIVFRQIEQEAEKYFRHGYPSGQFGELILFNFIQSFYKACPFLRKMRITTNEKLERNGADAIHLKIEDGFFVLHIGESKVYANASFTDALSDSIDSMTDTINNLRNEIKRYIASDYVNQDFNDFIEDYTSGRNLDKIKYKPICIIVYNETNTIDFDKKLEDEIKRIVLEKISRISKTINYSKLGSYLNDLEYIIFPIFNLSEILEKFDPEYSITKQIMEINKMKKELEKQIDTKKYKKIQKNKMENNIYKSLAQFELLKTAKKLNIYNKNKVDEIDLEYLDDETNIINIISFLISKSNICTNELEKNKILSSCAILNEYVNKSKYDLDEILIVILSNIGFIPSSFMLSNTYNKETKKYNGFTSYINMIKVIKKINENRITIKDKEYILTSFQKRIWNSMNEEKLIGISSPTSSGKTFIITLKIIQTILNNNDSLIIYIVPTLSLMNQITANIKDKLKEFEIHNINVFNNLMSDDLKNTIFILTQERGINLIDKIKEKDIKINILIIDEIQNIEKNAVSKGNRSELLYNFILDAKQDTKFNKVILSGPLISNINEIFENVLNEKKHKIEESHGSSVFNIVYSINKIQKSVFLNQYSFLTNEHIRLKLDNDENLKTIRKNINKKLLNSTIYAEYLNIFLKAFNNKINMIFAPTVDSEPIIAKIIKNQFNKIDDEKLDELIKFISETVHEKYFVCEYLKYGIMCNHGKMPYHVRDVLEYYFLYPNNKIKTLISTTTLIQGVNLPIQNIILRNNILGQREGKEGLTEYEIMNLKGRAGRLMKDFIGRTFILDQVVLDKNNINLENSDDKKIDFGYAELYKNNTDYVNDILIKNTEIEYNKNENNCDQLITYIRNTILLFKNNKNNGKKRLEITLGDNSKYLLDKYDEIYEAIKHIDINENIIKNNRHIDPIVLNKIKTDAHKIKDLLPINQTEIKNKMFNLLCYIRENFPYYFKDCLGICNDQQIRRISNNCNNWVMETPLKTIISRKIDNKKINNKLYSVSDGDINDIVNEVQKIVSFDLSKLLKPFYSLANNEDDNLKIINSIEIGAFLPLTKLLICLGINREVAIFLKDSYFKNIKENETNLTYIKNKLNEIISDKTLNYWYKVQIEKVL